MTTTSPTTSPANSQTPLQPKESLRQLVAPVALDFCERLLGRGRDGLLTFEDFAEAASELIADEPEAASIYLASMIAIEMHDEAPEIMMPSPQPRQPSRN
ncbi:MAG: hypothetical protein AB8H80_05710 [Planctomycetota bacterium]